MLRRFSIAALLVFASAGVASGAPIDNKADTALSPDKSPIVSNDLENPPLEFNTVVLQGLNKVTGRISKLDGLVGTSMRFGNLEIVAHRCWKSSPEERPENAALLEISELKPGEAPQRIFLGWMFFSPGLSGLEHPVYDINVLSCDLQKDAEKTDAPAATPAKPQKTGKTKKKKVSD